MSQKRPESESEFLDRLAHFLGNKADLTDQELRAYLLENGIQPDELVGGVQIIVQAELKKSRLAWQAKARKERLEAERRIKNIGVPTGGKTALLQRLGARLLPEGVGSPALAVQFNKLNALPEEDLRSLLADVEKAEKLADEFPTAEEAK